MPDPVQLVIAPHAGMWRLTEAGQASRDFSHVDRATHEAVARARELDASGEPAQVWVEPGEGKRIAIDVDPQVTQEQERRGPDAPIDVAAEEA